MLINESTLRSFIRQLLKENADNNQSATGNYSYYPKYGGSIDNTGYFAAWEGGLSDAKITEVVFVPVDIEINPYLYRFKSGNESSLVIDTNPKGKKTLEEMYKGLGQSKFKLDLNTQDKGMTDLKKAIETFFTEKLGGKLDENKLTRRQRRSLRNLSHDERIVESIIRKHILKENLGAALQRMADEESGKSTAEPQNQTPSTGSTGPNKSGSNNDSKKPEGQSSDNKVYDYSKKIASLFNTVFLFFKNWESERDAYFDSWTSDEGTSIRGMVNDNEALAGTAWNEWWTDNMSGDIAKVEDLVNNLSEDKSAEQKKLKMTLRILKSLQAKIKAQITDLIGNTIKFKITLYGPKKEDGQESKESYSLQIDGNYFDVLDNPKGLLDSANLSFGTGYYNFISRFGLEEE